MNAVGFSIAFAPKDPELIKAADATTDDFCEIPQIIKQFQQ